MEVPDPSFTAELPPKCGIIMANTKIHIQDFRLMPKIVLRHKKKSLAYHLKAEKLHIHL